MQHSNAIFCFIMSHLWQILTVLIKAVKQKFPFHINLEMFIFMMNEIHTGDELCGAVFVQ